MVRVMRVTAVTYYRGSREKQKTKQEPEQVCRVTAAEMASAEEKTSMC